MSRSSTARLSFQTIPVKLFRLRGDPIPGVVARGEAFAGFPHGGPTRRIGDQRRYGGAKLRRLAIFFGFLLPLILTLLATALPALTAAAALLLAAACGFGGVLLERWLFFAEAKHAVTLYYGTAAV